MIPTRRRRRHHEPRNASFTTVPRGNRGLVARIIELSLRHRTWVLSLAALLTVLGVWALLRTPVDAWPDLGDVQVIVRTPFPGQAPRIVEDQVTFPLTSAMLGVPSATAVRGYSLFGDSFVYVQFRDGTDPYWARSRIIERLAQVAPGLPEGARAALGPDATSLGWVYQYALTDRSGRHDIAQLRALQDWMLKFELQALPGVAEVASVGGMVKEYQVVLDPERLSAVRVTLPDVRQAIERGNSEAGGSVIELAESEYVVRSSGYVRGVDDLRRIPVKVAGQGVPVLLGDIAEVRIGPEMRRGIADLDGEGEAVGGIIVMRNGASARAVIAAVKDRLAVIARSLPEGVEIVPVYDRSGLIARALGNLSLKLVEEAAVVLLISLLFLAHLRSSVVVIALLPLGVLGAFLIMRAQGISANIMSLGGIAVAVGVMVDAAIVVVENLHRRLDGVSGPADARSAALDACTEVAPSLVISLLIVALSFVPILALSGEEGRLFAPLAYTKTYALLVAALLSMTVLPVLAWWLAGTRVAPAHGNTLNRFFAAAYAPVLRQTLSRPWSMLAAAGVLVLITLWPASRLGTELQPPMDEGDLLFMPTALPGLSADAARALLQRSNQLLRKVPEVQSVFGKAGRADSATDAAPLEMLETTLQIKPRAQWRPGLTPEALKAELRSQVELPGLTSYWSGPIRARIDMLATGMRAPLGVKVVGDDPAAIDAIVVQVEQALKGAPGAVAVYAERSGGGRYIDIDPDRAAAARYGLNIADLHDVVSMAIGGARLGETLEGRERFPIVARYPSAWRDSVERLARLPIPIASGAQILLQDVAQVRVRSGPSLIRSENGRAAGWIYVDVADHDVAAFIRAAQRKIDDAKIVPAGYTLYWSGEYEQWARTLEQLKIIVPVVVLLIVLLLYANFRSWPQVAIILGSLPVSMVGAVWLLWALDLRVSIAVVVGLIALAGLAAETGIVMLLYLNSAWAGRRESGQGATMAELDEAIVEGALRRLRPKLMTVFTIILGLLPLLVGSGAGSEIMRRIAAPMVGGMVSAAVLTLVVVPALFKLTYGRSLRAT